MNKTSNEVQLHPLNKNYQVELFDCEAAALNTYLKRYALQNQFSQGSRTYVATRDLEVIGYFTLTYGSISPQAVPLPLKKGMGNYPIPVLFLARLAVDKKEKGTGLGKALLKHALLKAVQASEIAGLSAVIVHVKNDSAKSFYQHYGFLPSSFDSFHLYLLLKDVKNNLKNVSVEINHLYIDE